VKHDIYRRFGNDPLPIDLDSSAPRIDLCPEFGHYAPVDADPPPRNEVFRSATRSDARVREHLLKANAGHGPRDTLNANRMRSVSKPWGYEIVWAETDRYVGKILHISAGQRLSRQYHVEKDETFLVEAGEMDLEIGEGTERRVIRMRPREAFHCPPNTIHRMIAVTDVDVIEVSTPELDDVVRLEDAYGREGTNAP